MQDVDYGISLEESGIVVESPQTGGSIARGNEALTLLDNYLTRKQFMDDILEVRLLKIYDQSFHNTSYMF